MAVSAGRTYQMGTAVAWVAMWTGAAILLRADADAFGRMLPLLAAGSLVGLALPGHDGVRTYLIGTLAVWSTLIAGTAILLAGTEALRPMLGLFAAGAGYFVIVVPVFLTVSWSAREHGARRGRAQEHGARRGRAQEHGARRGRAQQHGPAEGAD
ncbi:hypothetical protein [Nonomuraea zeae]|uniref:Uncharacterized protein n=1 Tax=Nonomuraea zeae TaxID=1642303 RepID=A0A5S4GTC5_9ACTN|nr:hypothetical protein [Nonomuraea zeae]TMR35781.1 hypothetical protein ETD85_12810 [Nonomuraea zeae]